MRWGLFRDLAVRVRRSTRRFSHCGGTACRAPFLAIVEFMPDGSHRVHYVRQPFHSEPDFGAASVNYSFVDLLQRATPPS